MQVNKGYDLTGTKELIMEILWNAEESMTVKEIRTINPFLSKNIFCIRNNHT